MVWVVRRPAVRRLRPRSLLVTRRFDSERAKEIGKNQAEIVNTELTICFIIIVIEYI